MSPPWHLPGVGPLNSHNHSLGALSFHPTTSYLPSRKVLVFSGDPKMSHTKKKSSFEGYNNPFLSTFGFHPLYNPNNNQGFRHCSFSTKPMTMGRGLGRTLQPSASPSSHWPPPPRHSPVPVSKTSWAQSQCNGVLGF